MSESPLMAIFTRKLQKSTSIELKELRDPLLSPSALPPTPKIYNPYAYPPDLKMAKEHGQARRVAVPPNLYDEILGIPEPVKSNESMDVCDCCGYPIANK